MEENGMSKRVLCMNLETTRLRGRPRKRWKNEVGVMEEWWRSVAGKSIQRRGMEKVPENARNHRILHMPKELMNQRKKE
jgi:hypothetical protein